MRNPVRCFNGVMADAAAKAPQPSKNAPHPCGCLVGTDKTCDRMTQRAFAQGHDARLSSRLAQEIAAGSITENEAEELIRKVGGSDLLVGKTHHSARLRKTNAEKPPKERKAKVAKPKDDEDDADAPVIEPSAPRAKLNDKVKVVHKANGPAGERTFDAVVVRNASQEIVARHRIRGENCDHLEYQI